MEYPRLHPVRQANVIQAVCNGIAFYKCPRKKLQRSGGLLRLAGYFWNINISSAGNWPATASRLVRQHFLVVACFLPTAFRQGSRERYSIWFHVFSVAIFKQRIVKAVL